MISHLSGTAGRSTSPPGVLWYTPYWSKIFMISEGNVLLLKFTDTTSNPDSDRSAFVSVIVLPEPGGPHRITGCRAFRYARITCSLRAVSTVGTTTDVSSTLSSCNCTAGTCSRHSVHWPVCVLTKQSSSECSPGGNVTPAAARSISENSSRSSPTSEPPKPHSAASTSRLATKAKKCSPAMGASMCSML